MGIIYNRKDTTVPFMNINNGDYFVVRTQENVPLLYRKIKPACGPTGLLNAVSVDTSTMEYFYFRSDDEVFLATVDMKVTY